MKKQRPIPPPGTAPDDAHLRLFLEKVHGYHTPPSVLELGQLAAALNLPHEDTTQPPWELARGRMEMAAHLWEAAANTRREMLRQMEATTAEFSSRSLLYGPLKTGPLLMPRIQWRTEGAPIPFRRFLEQVVGMAREDDRMVWWRAYMEAKVRKDQHGDHWRRIPVERRKTHPDWCEPHEFPIDPGIIGRIIAEQREHGIQRGFPASCLVEGFRLWRLGMKTLHQRAETPVSVEDAARKGLEAEKNAGS